MVTVPLLEIIFALVLSLLPQNTTEFSIYLSSDSNSSATFTRSGNDWIAKDSRGEALGTWKLDGLILTKTVGDKTEPIELKDWISYTNGQASVRNKPVTVTRSEGQITLSDESKEYSLNMAVIRFQTKKEPAP